MPDSYEAPAADAGAMPTAEYILELAVDLRAQWSQRNGEYLRARLAYGGDLWEGQGLVRPHDTRYSLTANYLKPFIDKDVQLLMGELPALMVEPPSADQGGRSSAEKIEGLLYGNWDYNKAHLQLLNAAFHQKVLGRGLLYYWWDPASGHVRWRSIVPENFYPAMDGDDIFEAVYVSRRLTRALQRQYPQYAEDITSDEGELAFASQVYPVSEVSGGITDALSLKDDYPSMGERAETLTGYTTVVDWWDASGKWIRIMGQAVHEQVLGYPVAEVPVIQILNGVNGDEREPQNAIEQLKELNQYYNIVLSQKADIIRKTADPPIIAEGAGDPAKVRASVSSGDGSVIPVKTGGKLSFLTWPVGSLPDMEGQMSQVLDNMFDLSGKPRSSFGQTVTNQSGVVTNLTLTPTLQSKELDQTLWGAAIVLLNVRILELYEAFSPEKEISFDTVHRRRRGAVMVSKPLRVVIKGSEIGGWTKNRVKWPSAIRVDDPVYLDGIMKQLQSEPQAISIYDALEMLGYEDVEARIDRIRSEREDPRIHPEVLQQTIESLTGLGGIEDPAFDGLADVDSDGSDLLSEGEIDTQTGALPSPVEE